MLIYSLVKTRAINFKSKSKRRDFFFNFYFKANTNKKKVIISFVSVFIYMCGI